MENLLVTDVWKLIIEYLNADTINNIISFKAICKHAHKLIISLYPGRRWIWKVLDMISMCSESLFIEYFYTHNYQWSNHNTKLISYMLGRMCNSNIAYVLSRHGKLNFLELFYGAVRTSNIDYLKYILRDRPLLLTDEYKLYVADLAVSSCNIPFLKYLTDMKMVDPDVSLYSLEHLAEPCIVHKEIDENYEFEDDKNYSEDKAIMMLEHLLSIRNDLQLKGIFNTSILMGRKKIVYYLLIRYIDRLEIDSYDVKYLIRMGDVNIVKLVKDVEIEPKAVIKRMSSSVDMIRYYSELGFKLSARSYSNPIYERNLNMLKYLHNQGIPVDDQLMKEAVRYYDKEIFDYLLSLGLKVPTDIYEIYTGLSLDSIRRLTEMGIPPNLEVFTTVIDNEDEEEALDIMKLFISKGYLPPLDISKFYFSTNNRKASVLKYLASNGYPINVINFHKFALNSTSEVFDFILSHTNITSQIVIDILHEYSNLDIPTRCRDILDRCSDDLTYVYEDVEIVHNLSMVIELERRGITAPKYILDKVSYSKLNIIAYFVTKCYPVSTEITNLAIERFNYIHRTDSIALNYLSYLWFHTSYEFDDDTNYKLRNRLGDRPVSLDIVMRDYIASL